MFGETTWIDNGCVDCGKIVRYPPHPMKDFPRQFNRVFSDVNMEVIQDLTTRHFIIILSAHNKVDRTFLSCKQNFSQPPLLREKEEIFEWAFGQGVKK